MSKAANGIAVLMTVHNRRMTTVACLKRLLPQLHENDRVFIVDDGSTDGTGEALREYAEKVKVEGAIEQSEIAEGLREQWSKIHLIQGDGNLYWAKGMSLAWKTALEEEPKYAYAYDGFLWLNDDAMLCGEALKKMKAADDGESLIVGQLVDSAGKEVYGLNVNGWVNGNFVYVPRKVYEKVGMICGEYAHAWADSDYAMRCKKAGVPIKSCGEVGSTEWHELRPSLKGRSLGWRLRSLRDPKGWSLHDLWLYRRRNWGVCAAIASSAHFVFHVLIGAK